jgi:hypothetical protein
MRSMFRSVLLALVAVMALSAVAAASASAETGEWLLNEKPVTESTPVTFSLQPEKTFTLLSGGGGPSITCASVTGKGTVAPKGAGTITEFKLGKCTKTSRGICEEETKKSEEAKEWVTAVNLPWKTELTGQLNIFEGKSADPGWQFECTSILGTLKGTCTAYRLRTRVFGYPEGVMDEIPELPPYELLKCAGFEAEVNVHIVLKGPEGTRLSFKE